MLEGVSTKLGRGAFSLVEAVVAIFLLSFAALSVLSLTQSGFVAQKRNQEIARANLVAQAVSAEIRLWASDVDNYLGSWAPYNRTFRPTEFPEYEVTVRAHASGRELDSPCAELESQWATTPRGKRTMPNAIVPVELKISWSDRELDSLTVLTYVGEPKRDVSDIKFDIVGPSRPQISMNEKTSYTVSARDGSDRPLRNLMFRWVADRRWVSITGDATRDGRKFEIIRDRVLVPPDDPPPTNKPMTVTCYADYAGLDLSIQPRGVDLP
jgi:type II secretory pathway pseudopilin PulG